MALTQGNQGHPNLPQHQNQDAGEDLSKGDEELIELDAFFAKVLYPASAKCDPVIRYQSRGQGNFEGPDATPVPLFTPTPLMCPQPAANLQQTRSRHGTTIMQAFLKLTTALYGMAGLGGVEESKAYKEAGRVEDHEKLLKTGQQASGGHPRKGGQAPETKLQSNEVAQKAFMKDDNDQSAKEGTVKELAPVKKDVPAEASEVKPKVEGRVIDILLRETETHWMFTLIGTCAEVKEEENLSKKPPAEEVKVQRKASIAVNTSESQDQKVKETVEEQENKLPEADDPDKPVGNEEPPTEEAPEEQDVQKEDDISEGGEEEEEKEKEEEEEEPKDGDQTEELQKKLETPQGPKKRPSLSCKEEAETPKKSGDDLLISQKYALIEKWSQTIDFPRKKKGTQSDPIGSIDAACQVVSKELIF